MDKYTKGVLTVIAVALVSISFQISDTKPINHAYANSDIQKVVICSYRDSERCADVYGEKLNVRD